MKRSFIQCGIIVCAFVSAFCWSFLDVHDFDSDGQRKRYQQLTYELRCPMCLNQNLADSNSQISKDLRGEVARLIIEGKTDREIKTFMVDRYGDFVLYRPPMQKNTLVLWWGPAVILALAMLAYVLILHKRSKITVRVEGEPAVEEESDELVAEEVDLESEKTKENHESERAKAPEAAASEAPAPEAPAPEAPAPEAPAPEAPAPETSASIDKTKNN